MTTNLQIIIEAIDRASGTLGKVGGSLKATGDRLADIRKPALVATAAIAGLVYAGIKLSAAAGKYASVKDAFKSMTDGMGVGVEDFEERVAKAAGGTLDKLTILQGGTRALSLMGREAFSDFGTQFAKMAELSKKAARATGQDVTYMFDSLITGMSRESKMILDNLGITVDLTQAKKDYAAQLGKEADELTIVEEKQAVLTHTLGKLEDNYSEVAVSAGGFSGAMSRLKATIKDAQLSIGDEKEGLGAIFNEIVRAIEPLIKEYTPKLVAGVKLIVKWFKELSPTGKKVLAFFVLLAPAIVIFTTAGIMLTKVLTIMSKALKVVSFVLKGLGVAIKFFSAHPIILAIMAVIAVAYLWYKNWDKIKEGLLYIWEAIRDSAQAVFGAIAGFFEPFASLIKYFQAVVEEGDYLNDWLTHLPEPIRGVVESIGKIITVIQDFIKYIKFAVEEGDWLNDWLTNLPEPLQNAIKFILLFAEEVKKCFTDIGNFLKGVVILWKELLSPIWKPLAEASDAFFVFLIDWIGKVSDLFVRTWTAIKDKVREIWGLMSDGIKEAAEIIGSYLEEKFNAIADFLYSIWSAIEIQLTAIWGSIKGVFMAFLEGVKVVWESVWNWVVDKIQWVYDRIKAIVDRIKGALAPVMNLVKGVGETVSGIGTSIGEGLKGIGEGIWGGVKGLIGIGAGTRTFPGFQHGGIATSPMLARIAETEPEAIIPLSKLRMGGDINIYIQGGNYLDREAGKKFAEILGKMIRKELRYQKGYG